MIAERIIIGGGKGSRSSSSSGRGGKGNRPAGPFMQSIPEAANADVSDHSSTVESGAVGGQKAAQIFCVGVSISSSSSSNDWEYMNPVNSPVTGRKAQDAGGGLPDGE